jgi:hypothetical protein
MWGKNLMGKLMQWRQVMLDRFRFIGISLCLVIVVSVSWAATPEDDFSDVRILYQSMTGIGSESGVVRRDPSDVIKVGNTYYVWYTKVFEGEPSFPEGYAHGTIWYASSQDGINWTEQGQAVGLGQEGKFDDYACFTPNILYSPATSNYYLYYTGVSNIRGVNATV